MAALPPAALALAPLSPPWVLMGLMALSMYFGFKWLTLARFLESGEGTNTGLVLGYLLAWPGMDARAFLAANPTVDAPSRSEWLAAVAKTFLGVALFWGVARLAAPHSELLAGGIGMAGIVLLLHFGLFHLLALLWRRGGVDAQPLMNRPLMASSVSDFWSHRWNLAFRDLAFRHAFRPLLARLGASGATLAVFFASGIVHELAISLPARGGYGLPTLYFLAQGLAMLAERRLMKAHRGTQPKVFVANKQKQVAKRHLLSPLPRIFGGEGKGEGVLRETLLRLFAWIVVCGGAFWLFHPPFVRNVIIPMMHTLGALQ